jgi:hypothetical protein
MRLYNPASSGKASGRALGGVFSHNRGLATFKKFTLSAQPNTESQTKFKSFFAQLQQFWATQLTYDEILLWNSYVMPWTNPYGQTVILTGINKFNTINSTLLQANKPIQRTPPTLTPSLISAVLSVQTDYLYINITECSVDEINAQAPFYCVEVAGDTDIEENEPDHFWALSQGKPISQKVLEKDYIFYKFRDALINGSNPQDWYIQIWSPQNIQKLLTVRITKYNSQGNFTAPIVYSKPITSPD